jgi:hypothetical protein
MSDVYDILRKAGPPVPPLESSAKIIDVTPARSYSRPDMSPRTPADRTRRGTPQSPPARSVRKHKRTHRSQTRTTRTSEREFVKNRKQRAEPSPLLTSKATIQSAEEWESDWSTTTGPSESAFSASSGKVLSSSDKGDIVDADQKLFKREESRSSAIASTATAAVALAAVTTTASAPKNGLRMVKTLVVTGLVVGTVFVILRLWKKIKELQIEIEGIRAELDVTGQNLTEEDVAFIAREKLEEILEQPATMYTPLVEKPLQEPSIQSSTSVQSSVQPSVQPSTVQSSVHPSVQSSTVQPSVQSSNHTPYIPYDVQLESVNDYSIDSETPSTTEPPISVAPEPTKLSSHRSSSIYDMSLDAIQEISDEETEIHEKQAFGDEPSDEDQISIPSVEALTEEKKKRAPKGKKTATTVVL